MKVFDYDGDAGLYLNLSGNLIDAAWSVSSFNGLYLVPAETSHILRFTTGTAYLVAGKTITGATSTFNAHLLAVVIGSGTLAGGDATGFILVSNPSGTLTVGGENYTVGSDACCTSTQSLECPSWIKGRRPTALWMTVETNTIRYTHDGTTPTTAVGHSLAAGGALVLKGAKNIYNLKVINAAGASNSSCHLTFLFR